MGQPLALIRRSRGGDRGSEEKAGGHQRDHLAHSGVDEPGRPGTLLEGRHNCPEGGAGKNERELAGPTRGKSPTRSGQQAPGEEA